MNKKIISLWIIFLSAQACFGQANISPAKPQAKKVIILGAVLHLGNGKVIPNGYLIFDKGKITGVGDATTVRLDPTGAELIQGNGKHVYPGFIGPLTNLGLIEISAVKATLDYAELGEMNPNIRSIVAYNTDSKIPATLRSNGVLMAQITPQSGTLSGSSSVVQLDAWNWEDAAIKIDDAIHLHWPSIPRRRSRASAALSREVLEEQNKKAVEALRMFFDEAQAYAAVEKPDVINTRFAAMKHLFDGSQKLFLYADHQKDILAAISFAKRYHINAVLVGADDAIHLIDTLKTNNIPVIVKQPHALPNFEDEDVNLPYKNAAILARAGIQIALSIDGYWQLRNLPFMAGTVAAWGLDKEQALQTITLNTANILGIGDQAGSLESGKDATLFISEGDALDMIGNKVERAFIQGRDINLDNLHKQLDRKFSSKYGIQ